MEDPITSGAPLTVVGLQVDSYQRLGVAELHPSPTGLVPVHGKNGAGKSSLLGAMLEALGVERSKLPIQEGQDGAEVLVDLGELVVRARWSRDAGGAAKRKVTIEGKDGGRVRSPAAVLEALRGEFADPIAFQSMKPDEQVRTVLAVVGLDAQLDALEGEAEVLYERRRDLGRDKVRAEAACEAAKQQAATLPPRPEGGLAPIEELTDELARAQEHNADIEKRRLRVERISSEGTRASGRVQAIDLEIERLQAERAEEQATLDARRKEYTTEAEALAQLEPVDLTPIKSRIAAYEAEADNEGVRQAAENAAIHLAEAAAVHAEADEALKAKRDQIAALLGSASFPVDGMSYDPEARQLLIGGIPFGQASQAERLRVAAAVAMAGNPRIKVVFAREGSLLDAASQRVLAEAAEAAGFQLWLEIVAEQPGTTGVWVDDGEAVDVQPKG